MRPRAFSGWGRWPRSWCRGPGRPGPAFDDDAAIRTLTALHDLGLSAPGDLPVVGFDDIEYGELTTPALTAIHVDAEAHGRQAARSVLGLKTSDLARPPGHVIIRDSA